MIESTTSSTVPTYKDIEKQQLEKNRVIVRLWTSTVNPDYPGRNVGHVSVEIEDKKLYMSLWPKQANDDQPAAKTDENKGITSAISHEFVANFELERTKYEGREPEATFCFYSLDTVAIEGKFNEFKANLTGWTLFGSNRLIVKDAESCVSMAWALLRAGGIQKYASPVTESSVASKGSSFGSFFSGKAVSTAFTKGSSSQADESHQASSESKTNSTYSVEMAIGVVIKSPDYLVALLKEAKLAELKKEPLSTEIIFKNETDVTSDASSGCTIV
jgi:hypothetical protein